MNGAMTDRTRRGGSARKGRRVRAGELTHAQLAELRRCRRCGVCGQAKQPGADFCLDCWERLPGDVKQVLVCRDDELVLAGAMWACRALCVGFLWIPEETTT